MNATRASTSLDPRHSPAAIADRLAPHERRRGRGAATNASGRYEILAREDFDDGWTREEAPEPLATEVTLGEAEERHHPQPVARHLRSTGRSIPIAAASTAASIASPVRPTPIWACRPGSISRASCSPSRTSRRLLERELAAPKYSPATIALGTNTDPYQPIERQYRITRSVLESLQRARHPVEHRHQVESRPARSRHPERHGARRAGQGVRLGDDARPDARAQDGAARTDAREAARGDRAR